MARPAPKHHLRAVFNTNIAGISGPDDDGRGFGHVEAWHKTAWDASPYCVPNELICAEIGTFLRLPIPAFGITYGHQSQYFFTSLNFNFQRKEQIPPIEPDLTWKQLPDVCTGIILFDVLIANSDRHDENLAVDKVSSPSAIIVFDHDQALFGGGFELRGADRLNELQNRLGISNGDVTKGNRHCLLDVMDSADSVCKWLDRIDSIPSWFIESVCERAGQYGLNRTEIEVVTDFLLTRRSGLEQIVRRHHDEFSLVSSWPWNEGLFQ